MPRCQGAVRIGKEDLDREPLSQLLVLGHFFPSIVGQGLPQQCGHVSELSREALTDTRRICPLHLGQDDQACRPLHLDQVALPVAEVASHTVAGPGAWPDPPDDANHHGGLFHGLDAGAPCALDAARQDDGLGREEFAHIVSIRTFEASSNLFR